MSHHFDTEIARKDPALNLCDLYLFATGPDRVAMVMTVHPHVGPLAASPLHREGVYSICFDADDDGEPDLTFEVRPRSDGDGYQVSWVGPAVPGGPAVELRGRFGVATSDPQHRMQVFVGSRADPFAGDADALTRFLHAYAQGAFWRETHPGDRSRGGDCS